MMRSKSLRMMVGVLLIGLAVGLTAASCKKKQGDVTTGIPAMPQETVKAYKKSIEETKKITVATVNGESIPMSDLLREMNLIAPMYIKPGEKRNPDLDKKIREEALEGLIRDELVHQEAIRQGMKVTPEMVQNELKKIKAGLKSEQAYKENLDRLGVTEEEMKHKIERKLLDDMISRKEVYDKVKIDPKTVKQAYEREKLKDKGPSGQMSFEEARPLIEHNLMTEAAQKREEAWIQRLTKAAKIEITAAESSKAIQGVY